MGLDTTNPSDHGSVVILNNSVQVCSRGCPGFTTNRVNTRADQFSTSSEDTCLEVRVGRIFLNFHKAVQCLVMIASE